MSVSKVEVLKIAQVVANKSLGIKTLTPRNSDSFDFYDLSVWSIEEALLKMYEFGYQKGELESLKKQNQKLNLEVKKLKKILDKQ